MIRLSDNYDVVIYHVITDIARGSEDFSVFGLRLKNVGRQPRSNHRNRSDMKRYTDGGDNNMGHISSTWSLMGRFIGVIIICMGEAILALLSAVGYEETRQGI